MKIQYIGKYPAKTDGIGEHEVNEILDVDKELGERLIRQKNWRKPEPQTQSQPSPQKKEQKQGGG